MQALGNLLKGIAVLAAVLIVVWLLYQFYQGFQAAKKAGADAADAIRSAMSSSKAAVQGAIDHTTNAVKGGSAAASDTASTGFKWLNPIKALYDQFTESGGIITPQTLGSAQNSVNIAPHDVKILTPSNQMSGINATTLVPETASQGITDGTTGRNVIPSSNNSTGIPRAVSAPVIPDASFDPLISGAANPSFMDIVNGNGLPPAAQPLY